MSRYVLLLRGINLGKAHRLGMADLRELLRAEGHGDVETLLQSGNVVLDSELPPDELARSTEQALERRFGFAVPVVVRSREEVLDLVARDPLGHVADDPTRWSVWFYATEVPAEVADVLGAADPGDDVFQVDGREVHLWCPHGQANSALMTAASRHRGGPVGTVGTARNWSTVLRVAERLRR